MGDSEMAQCDMCEKTTTVARKYYYYDIKCDCCNTKDKPHFEIVRHCVKCEPKPPRRLSVVLSAMAEQNGA